MYLTSEELSKKTELFDFNGIDPETKREFVFNFYHDGFNLEPQSIKEILEVSDDPDRFVIIDVCLEEQPENLQKWFENCCSKEDSKRRQSMIDRAKEDLSQHQFDLFMREIRNC